MPPTLKGLPERDRPILPELNGDLPFWQMRRVVSNALTRCGLRNAAREFRYLAEHECDHDEGMLFTLALNYVRVIGQQPTEEDA